MSQRNVVAVRSGDHRFRLKIATAMRCRKVSLRSHGLPTPAVHSCTSQSDLHPSPGLYGGALQEGGYKIMKADSKTEAEIMAVINQVKEAFNKRDLDRIPLIFAPDPDLIFYGTGADEKGMGLEGIRADWERAFAQSEASSMEILWSSISAAGSVAWGAFDGIARATVKGQEISLPIRFTSVLERRDGQWLIVQSHASTPAAGQKEGESWPTG